MGGRERDERGWKREEEGGRGMKEGGRGRERRNDRKGRGRETP